MRLGLNLTLTSKGSAGDTTPPVVTITTAGPQDGATGAVPLEITLVEAGGDCTVYVVLYDAAESDPTATEIQNGQKSGGAAAPDSWTVNNVTPGSGVSISDTLVDGLSGSYKFAVVAVDPSSNVSTPDYSGAVTIDTTTFTDPTSLGAKLIAWLDFTDTSTLWQDTGRTTAATTASDPVRYVDDKSSNGNDFSATSTASAGNGLVISGGVDINDAGFKIDGTATGLTSGMEAYALIDPDGDTSWELLGQDANSGFFAGIAQNGSGSAVDGGTTGTITHMVDGVDQSSPTRDTLHDAIAAAGPGYVIQGLRGIDLSGLTTTLLMLAYSTSVFRLSGNCRHFVLTTALTTDERANLDTWLDSEK